MSDKRHERRPSRSLWGVALAVVVLAVWLVWSQWSNWFGGESAEVAARAPASVEAREPMSENAVGEVPPSGSDGAAAAATWSAVLGGPPAWPVDPLTPGSCEAVSNRLQRACAHLDRASYFVGEPPPNGSCAVIERVAVALARRPPSPSSELRSFATILDNTFHLFRTLDRETVQWLRTVLREEDGQVEPLAYALYGWAVTREGCDEQTALRTEPLADYAVFLFRTLGGQAYLRRRSPKTEALTSFYALLMADHAIQSGHNPHGFDPRPEIERARALIAAQPLALRDDYLRMLDEMSIRWRGKSGS